MRAGGGGEIKCRSVAEERRKENRKTLRERSLSPSRTKPKKTLLAPDAPREREESFIVPFLCVVVLQAQKEREREAPREREEGFIVPFLCVVVLQAQKRRGEKGECGDLNSACKTLGGPADSPRRGT